MQCNRMLNTLLLLAVTASTSFAQGAASIAWNNCTGPIDLAVSGGSAVNAYVSVLGHSQIAEAYKCVTDGRAVSGAMRDAWRFDPIGCEGSALFTLNHIAPVSVSKTCPSFQGDLQSQQVKAYQFDGTTGTVRITLVDAYPNNSLGNPGAVNPTTRYFLANYQFDLTSAVAGAGSLYATCGGVEVPTCWVLYSATWFDLQGIEHPWAIAQGFITTNDPNNASHCGGGGAVPALSKTWGSIKSQYRN